MSDFKLNIFETLRNIDTRNLDFYSKLTDEQKSGFSGVVVMRWASAAQPPYDEWYLEAINERANVHFHQLTHHPELQYKLLAMNGTGDVVRHDWIKPGKKKTTRNHLEDFMLKYWKRLNTTELEILLNQFDKKSFNEFVDGAGLEKKESTKIKQCFADFTGV